jgi:hypothetical protein
MDSSKSQLRPNCYIKGLRLHKNSTTSNWIYFNYNQITYPGQGAQFIAVVLKGLDESQRASQKKIETFE